MLTTPQLDYLLVFGFFRSDLCTLALPDWEFIDLNKSTSIFKHQFELKSQGIRYATILFKPHSSILPADSGMIKLDNWLLYNSNAFSVVQSVFKALSFEFKRVSRVDVCCDFTAFNNLLSPQSLIQGFFGGKYIKKGKSKFKSVGSVEKKPVHEYLKFGSNYSQISAYLYNKSLEMRQKTHKEWIAKRAESFGYSGSVDLWRLEFSIKLQSSIITDNETAEILDFTLPELFSPSFLFGLWDALMNKYFAFVEVVQVEKNGRLVEREKHLPLLPPMTSNPFSFQHLVVSEGNKKNKLLVSRIYNLHREMKENSKVQKILTDDFYRELVDVLGLNSWCKVKGIQRLD